MSVTGTDDVLDGVRVFLLQRDEYRRKLEGELHEVEARAEQIKAALLQLSGDASSDGKSRQIGQRVQAKRVGPNSSIPELICHAVSKGPAEGLTAGEIVKAVIELRPTIKNTTIYPTIYRMRDSARLLVVDDHYTVPAEETA